MLKVRFRTLLGVLLALCLVGMMSTSAMGQATISTGAIVGTVADPSGAVISGAKVIITSKATGGQVTLTSSTAGNFNSGGLIPGGYTVRVTHTGFKVVDVPVTVQVGAVSSVIVKLPVGASTEVVEVTAAAVAINTEQATVQGVLTTQQIDTLPISGRNFLDLAQLEPGVQIQDALNFDPTKGGFTGISIGGRTGRTTRIELDGQDITDETVGTTVTNVSQSAIQEFSISQSSLDMSTELTSSGAVQVISRAGTNSFHGEAFYLFRDRRIAANFPGGLDLPFQRNQEGGRFGGPLVKDKLFFFLDVEHVKQDLASPVNISVPAPLSGFSGQAPTPFRESTAVARLDYQFKPNARLFYRLNYDNNRGTTNFGFAYALYANTNNTPAHVWGVDFNTGDWVHSIRLGYLKFVNRIGDTPTPVNVFPGALVRVNQFWSGPNYLAPQATFQSNRQAKYDGSRIFGRHNVRYGIGLNHIRGGGFASFFALTPYMSGSSSTNGVSFATDSCDTALGGASTNGVFASTSKGADPTDGLTPCFPGGSANPLNYGLSTMLIGNGQGFATELPAFKYPAGGQYDNRFQAYIGDSWKIKPYLTLTYGLRYVRDTGRTNSDLAAIPCSALDPALAAFVTTCPTGGNIFDMFGAGLGKKVRQDNNNFAPSLGFAWDLSHNGKTVIRGGAGVYYENAIFNNVLFSRSMYLKTGLFWSDQSVCPSGLATIPGQAAPAAFAFCGQAIGLGAPSAIALEKQLEAATAAAGPSANPTFIGNNLSPYGVGANPLAPNYRSPYSFQMNVGVQHEMWQGTVVSADYIRNVNLRYLMGIDTNHVGDSRYLSVGDARAAISATNAGFGCGASFSAAAINCSIAAGASMADFAGNGLGSGRDVLSGFPWYEVGAAGPVAFGGINPEAGANDMLFPIGRSVYNALQVSWRTNKANPVSFLKNLNFQMSYTYSRFSSLAADQDFINEAADMRNPLRYFGPTAFDRKHQIGFGLVATFPKYFQLSLIQHLGSPLPATLSVQNLGRADENFHSDLTGDGTDGDIIANVGNFQRSVSVGGLTNFVANFNSKVAGTLTPAGQALVDNNLMTQAQLVALGATVDPIPALTPGYVGNDWINTTDLRLAFPIKIRERFTIEPMVAFYNLFNVANYNGNPDARISGIMNGAGLGYVTKKNLAGFQAYQTPSLFNYGSPRQAELELRITW